MTITIDGAGSISGVSATGLSSAQNVPYANLPTGSVLQVVQGVSSTQASSASTTYTDTGLTATITPKYSTSKILVLVACQGVGKETGNTWARLQLVRNSSIIGIMDSYIAATSSTALNWIGSVCTNLLDSPATTSATTYKVQLSAGNGATAYINASTTEKSSITLLEIAG